VIIVISKKFSHKQQQHKKKNIGRSFVQSASQPK